MVVLPVEGPQPVPAAPRPGPAVTEAPANAPATRPAPPRSAPHVRSRALGRLLPAALAVLLAAPLLATARHVRPAPYGDHLSAPARVEHATPGRLRTRGAAVEAYDAATGRVRWSYAREGRRPLAVLPARVHALALWDDGLVTDTAADGRTVRWHRALPGAAPWLAAHGGGGVLRLLGRGERMLAVVTPGRIAAYRTADGDLRWVLPAHGGCAFVPERAVRRGGALLLAQPCAAGEPWTAQIIGVDDLGRITPSRTPLGNERHSPERPHTGKVVARPR
ncbi:hypothetical protein ACFVYF_00310 [Streptomyces sp. NPDC058274]|uniref:hypothetical protein n=1 Tax=Streptomyces sp. NPDC058274 TaxID=3346416 RepID=UPI0036E90EE0